MESREYLEEYSRFFKDIINDIKDTVLVISKSEKEILFQNQRAINFNEEFPFVMKNIMREIFQSENKKSFDIVYDENVGLAYNIRLYNILWDKENAFICVISKKENNNEQKLNATLFIDMQTGLYNRRYCLKRINELLVDKMQFIVSFIDMDNLKYVNENYGYEEGDKYIDSLVEVFNDTFRKTDAICRFGGDEFIVIMPNCPEELAEKRISQVRNKLNSINKQYAMSFSYGNILVSEDNSLSREDILKLADKKMYDFKKQSKAEKQ